MSDQLINNSLAGNETVENVNALFNILQFISAHIDRLSDIVIIIMLQLLRCISLCSGSSLKINLPLTTELLCD